MQSSLKINKLQLFCQNELLLSLNEQVNGGEILTIMGPSGSGKSSLLDWLSGTLSNDFNANGEVWLNGQNMTQVPAYLRHIGVLYQDPILFSHMSVAGNIAFAMPKGDKKQRVDKIEQSLIQVGLEGMGDRHPDNLSGGQQARVALLRMLLSEPQAILLDEPFSKLDTQLRENMRHLVFDLVRERQLPTIMVTHDLIDAETANGKIITLSKPS